MQNWNSAVTTGTVNAVGTTTYYAPDDCIFYFFWKAQANNSLILGVWINDKQIIDFQSGEAVQNTVSIVPFPLQKGDKLVINQSNNRDGVYFVMPML